MKIAVAGVGYVGLSNAVLLAQHNEVKTYNLRKEKAELINAGKSPIVDEEISAYLSKGDLQLYATTEASEAYSDAELIVIATPTNYDPKRNYFDISSIENVLDTLCEVNQNALIIIKSTVPVGYTLGIKKQYPKFNILFSPEFLREGKTLFDNRSPARFSVLFRLSGRRTSAPGESMPG